MFLNKRLRTTLQFLPVQKNDGGRGTDHFRHPFEPFVMQCLHEIRPFQSLIVPSFLGADKKY